MPTHAIDDVDFTPYQSAPLLTSEATYVLALDLDALEPADAPTSVGAAAAQMRATAEAIRAELVRRVEHAGHPPVRDTAFDVVVDRLWAAIREQLEYWQIFADPAVDELDPEQQAAIDLPALRDRAELATELHAHLFGDDGLAFTQRPYPEQLALMTSRIEFIRASPAADAYAELLGPKRLDALEVAVARYQRMVRERASRTEVSGGLRSLRRRLQRQITIYAASMLGTIDADAPASVAKVLAALQPMVAARRGRPRDPSEPVQTPALDDGPTPGQVPIPALEA